MRAGSKCSLLQGTPITGVNDLPRGVVCAITWSIDITSRSDNLAV
jgi:hypothetical protein